MIRVGLISDTHGLLRAEAVASLEGCNHIIHAGDIGGASVLEQLASMAPVTAVRGNNDEDAWADHLPATSVLEIGGVAIHVVHDIADLPHDIETCGIRVVVSGHSHKPQIVSRNGVLYVNPGSAGRRRFKLPVTVAELLISGGSVSANIFTLL